MAFLLGTCLVGAFVLVGYYISWWLVKSETAQAKRCRDPSKRETIDPILGLGYDMSDAKSDWNGTSLPDGEALHHQYGLTYYQSSVFGRTIKTASERNIHTVFGLKAQDWGVGPYRFEAFRPFCGAGILSTDGHLWKRSRSLLKPFFEKGHISDLTAFEKLLKRLLGQLPQDGSTVDMDPLLSALFMDTSARFVVGESLGLLHKDEPKDLPVSGEAFLKAFRKSILACGLSMKLGPFRILMPRSLTTKHWRIVHQFFDSFVDRALKAVANGEPDPLKQRHTVINAAAQQTTDRVEVRNQGIQIMLAALDTVPVLVCNTLFCLSRNPDIWDRLRVEVATVRPDTLTIDETRKLKLPYNILYESLRLYPVFPILARDALRDTILPTGGGLQGDQPIFARAGTRVVADFWTLHRAESVFGPTPEAFNPDRWNSIQPRPWQYMAFGGEGMRNCPARYKALGEASCVLIRLAQRFKRIESRDSKDWAGRLRLAAKNTNGCKIALIPA